MAAKEMKDIEWYQGRSQYLEKGYKDRNDMYEEIDAALHGEWELPEDFAKVDWATRAPDPSFAITVNAATRILADVKPRISITPRDSELMRVADEQEKGLGWLQNNASRRRNAHIISDVGASAVKYGEVCAHVTYLPMQVKGIEKAKGNTKRWEAMSRRSPFLVEVFHPKSVFPRYSALGLEEVAMFRKEDPAAVVDMWGDKAEELRMTMEASINEGGKAPDEVIYKVYMSYDWHAVWVEYTDTDSSGMSGSSKTIEILNEKWRFPFLPWSCRIGGTNLEDNAEDQRNPLLKTMYDFDLYNLSSSIRSMRISDVIRSAGQAKRTLKSASGQGVEIIEEGGDYYEQIDGEDDIVDRAPQIADPAMQLLSVELAQDHQKATLSDLLLGGEIPANAAFATINLVTHSALAAIKPVREVIEGSMADISEIMLLWIHYGGKAVEGFGKNQDGEHEVYYMHPDDIDPNNIYINVDVDADLPTDRQARAVTARMLVESGFYSSKEAMEDVGIKDVTAMEEEIYMDNMAAAMLQLDLKNLAFESDIQLREEMKQSLIPELLQDQDFLRMAAQVIQKQMEDSAGGAGGNSPSPPPVGGPPVAPGGGGGGGEQPAVTGQVGGQGENVEQGDLGIPPETGGANEAVPAEFSPQASQTLRPNDGSPAFS